MDHRYFTRSLEVLLPALACAGALLSFGCGDDKPAPGGHDAAMDGSSPPLDASTGSSADAQAAAPDAAAGPRFEIALSSTGCLDSCPNYDLEVDQAGNVMYNGRGNIRQQGWGGKLVSPDTASELLELVNAADYWSLQDVYREDSDGCAEVEDDRATYIWRVTNDGSTKIVVDYQGCQGVPELDAMRALPALLIEKLELDLQLGS